MNLVLKLFLAGSLLAWQFSAVSAVNPQLQSAPARVLQIASHLKSQKFVRIYDGISALKTAVPNGVSLIALKLNPTKLRFGLVKQDGEHGDWVEDTGISKNAFVAFNGGFFSIDKNVKKFPVGLLKIDGVKYSTAWKKSGGYLIFREDGVAILPTAGNAVPKDAVVLQ